MTHGDRCVCVECFRSKMSTLPTVSESLRIERQRADSIVRLDTYQRKLLDTFTKRWNATRAPRGLRPKQANDALTEGLEALIAMIGQE